MKGARYTLLGLIILAIAFRIALPYVLKHQINKSLKQSADYTGYLEDVSLSLIRGTFNLNGLHLRDKKESVVLYLPRLGLYLQWSGVLHRKILLAVHIQEPRLLLKLPQAITPIEQTPEKAREKLEKIAPGPPKPTLRATLRKLPHFRIDSLAIKNGQIKLTENYSVPEQVVWLREIELAVTNLTNSRRISKSLFAHAEMRLKTNETGDGSLRLTFNPVEKAPTFELHTQITDVQLADFNPLFQHEFGLTVEQGMLSMFTEDAAAKGAFQGYVKPVIKNLQVSNPDKGKPFKAIKKAIVQTVAHVLQSSKQELSSKIPIEGRFEDPNIGIIPAIFSVLSNAISSSIRPALQGTPTLKDTRKRASEIKKNAK